MSLRDMRAFAQERHPAGMAWCTGAALLTFLCLLHLGALLSFAADRPVSPLVAPAALLLSLPLGDWLGRCLGLSGQARLGVALLVLATVAASLLLAAAFFDLTWDGQWYHQTAVYKMAQGWNPVRDPMAPFNSHYELWVRHYAKGPWHVALPLFQTTGSIEMAKAGTWIAFAAGFLIVLAGGIELGLRRGVAALIATLVSLNPVIVCELCTHQVDGLLICYLACFVIAVLCFLRRPSLTAGWIVLASSILCINTKFTGLVYLAFFGAAGGLYALFRRRDLLLRYAALQAAGLVLGAAVFGFNPYVTNTLHRGHPLYPICGTEEHPGLARQGHDDIENVETPKNMMGRSRFVRLAYGIFAHPGAHPFFRGENASWMRPFAVTADDVTVFYFHDVRVGGFGPLFSGAFLLSLLLLAVVLVRPTVPRGVVLLLVATTITSLLVSKHTWWARYGPQLWWLPLVPLAAALYGRRSWFTRLLAGALAVLLLVNGVVVAAVHTRWEVSATRDLRAQLADLRGVGPIDVDFAFFEIPVGERLRAAGVEFRSSNLQGYPGEQQFTLVSVCPGYPCPVRVAVRDAATAARLRERPQWR